MVLLSETRSAPTASPAAWLAQLGGQGDGGGGMGGDARAANGRHLYAVSLSLTSGDGSRTGV